MKDCAENHRQQVAPSLFQAYVAAPMKRFLVCVGIWDPSKGRAVALGAGTGRGPETRRPTTGGFSLFIVKF